MKQDENEHKYTHHNSALKDEGGYDGANNENLHGTFKLKNDDTHLKNRLVMTIKRDRSQHSKYFVGERNPRMCCFQDLYVSCRPMEPYPNDDILRGGTQPKLRVHGHRRCI